MVLHRCKGCDLERHNRIAADDSPLLLMRLPLVEPRTRAVIIDDDSRSASA
jgi:hypothetical protein